jgi:ribonuclease BN (tRNA processing enzyme)
MHSAKVPFVLGGGWKSAEHRIEAMARYHTFPEKLGLIAKDADPKILATTHMVSHSDPSELMEIIGHDYSGALVIGEDLMTI